MPQEKIFTKLKDENVFRQPKPTILLDHMKNKSKFCTFQRLRTYSYHVQKRVLADECHDKERSLAKIFEEESLIVIVGEA